MTTERDANRKRFPEFAEAIDFLRSRGITPSAALVEDADGVVLAGRRPPRVMDEFWIDSETLERLRSEIATPRKAPRSKR